MVAVALLPVITLIVVAVRTSSSTVGPFTLLAVVALMVVVASLPILAILVVAETMPSSTITPFAPLAIVAVMVAVVSLPVLAFVAVALATALPSLASFLSPVGPTVVVFAPTP
jgi:hypothetical protein